ncbi:MAG: lipopolysaccharide biosynthesis protein [bacterium]|nr:lipopolysaccharide biosynthesis protein [bacterium]MDD3969233.1 lipopolysaccharide biosynthesis protein [Proteiniphilum sp.]MDD4458408.1 lipopolysaccharide biosynthesis protein [Proteiniphilum sp.]
MTEPTLKHKTTLSLFWSFLDKFGQQILNFLSMLIMMNILATEDYGLIGSLAVFVAFSSILVDSGFGRALLNRKELEIDDYATVFYFNITLSILLYLLFFFAAPLLGELFNTRAIIPVVRILFLSLIINAFALIHQTILIKKADFRGLTRINMLSLLVADLAAILMAIAGKGVWALVAQTLLYAFGRSFLLLLHTSWLPNSRFSITRLKSFFAFSHKLLLTSAITTTINNIYPSLIAAFYPMSQVAFFNQAKKYQEIPFLTIGNTFRSVSMLILPEINRENVRLKRVISKIIKSIAFLSFPIGMMMIVVAEPTFYLFFKEKWLPSVPFFQILTIAGMFSPFVYIFNELFVTKENAHYFLGVEAIKGAVLILLILLLFPYGITALALSWIIYMFVTLLISVIFSKNLINYRPLDLLKDTLPYLGTAIASAALSCLFTRQVTNSLLFILLNLLIIALSYLTLCKLMRLEMVKEIEEWFGKRQREDEKE